MRRLCAAVLGTLVLALSGCGGTATDHCVKRASTFAGDGPGFELISLTGRSVWGTRDWSTEEFADLTLPLSWKLWRKNDTRLLLADRGLITHSPGCLSKGEYNVMTAFGRDLVQVVKLQSFSQPTNNNGLIRRIELEKYHELQYAAGRTIRLLHSPNGERFIAVARTLDRQSDTPTLPEGWRLTEHLLDDDLYVDLKGEVSVLRMDNEDSYQGPLSEELLF